MEKRISALEGGNLLRQAGWNIDGRERFGLCLGVALGTAELPGLDGAAGTRVSQAKLKSRSKMAAAKRNSHPLSSTLELFLV
jgi:hypothetical protein